MDLTAIRIGDRVRTIRTERNWSVAELALRVGLAHPVVSAVEDGLRVPTLDLLYRIAAGLEVSPGELLPSTDDRPKVEVHLPITEAPDSSTALIIGGGPGNPTQTYLFEMAAGESDEGFSEHQGEELLVVMEGEVVCSTLGGPDVTVTAGRSHSVLTHIPHSVRITDKGPARFLLVCTYSPED